MVGGSQGARVMSDVVPGAIERLEPALWSRLVLTQQVRQEDMARVRAVYDRLKINAELQPFFTAFANVAWLFGLHDRPWGPARKIFGTVRYMNEAGLRRKFDMDAYVKFAGELTSGRAP